MVPKRQNGDSMQNAMLSLIVPVYNEEEVLETSFKRMDEVMRGIGYEGAYIIELYRHSYREEDEILASYQKVKDFLVEY